MVDWFVRLEQDSIILFCD